MLGPGAVCEMENRSANWLSVSQCLPLTALMCISGSTTLPPPMDSSDSMPNSPMSWMYVESAAVLMRDPPPASR
jgi:hypothetical protein